MAPDLFRFEDFELDLRSYQVRRSGRSLKLERIPMEVLFLLAERRGQLVTREEIIEKLWGKNTFLDTDNAINTAIRKIRQVLEDDPAQPRFVQTVTGKGYRFISRLAEEVGVSAQEPMAAEEKERKALEEGPVPPLQATDLVKKRWAILAGTLAVFAFFVTGYIYFRYAPRKHALTETDTIVLADFTNTTGDPVFDGTLRQGLAVQLEQSPFLSLVSEDRIQQVLRLMGKPADARLTPEIAREICERTASAAVLDGSITGLGSQYVLGLRARDCRTGDVLAEEQVQAARNDEVLNALGQGANKFRTRLGESLTTVKQYNTPLADATTPSLEALKAYSVPIPCPALRHRLLEKRQDGDGTGSCTLQRKARWGRLDFQRGRVRLGILRAPRRRKADVPACSGFGSKLGAAGCGSPLRDRRCGARSPVRKCGCRKAESCARARSLKEQGRRL
jgi:eukaryotic-like serine/threonine-protein kinase